MSNLTESIVSFIGEAHELQIPDEAFGVARRGFTDALGVLVAGAHEPVTQALANWASGQGGRGESRLLLGSHDVPSSRATLVGSTSAHAYDFDDHAFSNPPSALLVPAILAEVNGRPLQPYRRELLHELS